MGALVIASSLAVGTCRVDNVVAPPVEGVLVPAMLSVSDSAPQASGAIRTTKVALGTSPAGSVSWRAERARSAPWLALARTTGSAPDTLEIRLNPAGLTPGLYRDTIILSTNNYSAPPVRVPIAFAVHPCRVTAVSLDSIVNAPLSAADCGSPRTAGRFARLFQFAGTGGDSITVELQATGFDAQLVLDTVPTGGAGAPLAQASACGGAVGDPCIPYFRLPRTGAYYVEVNGPVTAAAGTFVLHVYAPGVPAGPDQLRQFLADSATAIALGAVVTAQPIVFRAQLTDPDVADALRLELELRSTAAAFTGTPTHQSAAVASGASATIVTSVPDDSSYHWRVRAADQTGRRSAWVAFGGNPETAADFTVAVPQIPAAPAALAQLEGTSRAPIAVGGASRVGAVTFRAAVTDPDPGDQLRLEVEVRPTGTAFTSTATLVSVPVASGDTAEVNLTGLADHTAHHWQARVVDQTGRASAWTPYGANAETAADFAIAVPVAQFVFTVQPTTTTAGQPMVPAIQVTALTADGSTAVSFDDSVSLMMGTNPGGAAISGTVTVPASLGVATFANARFDRAGTGYTVVAGAAALPGITATSTAFTVVAGPASQLAFTVQPSTVTSAAAIAPAVRVAAQDAGGNTVVGYTGVITVSLGANPGGGSLSGTLTATAVAGVATLPNLRIDKTGAGYTLVASAAGVSSATSAAFTVTPAAGAVLEFTAQPVIGDAGLPLTPAWQVRALDAQGNAATGFTGDVTLAIAANPGGGVLSGITTRAAVAGVATFPGLTIDKVGVGYTVAASAAGLTPDTSAPFTITPANAARLVFGNQPASTTAGGLLGAPLQVRVQDGFGNLVTTFSGSLTVTLDANPSGATLLGTTTVAVVGGLADFADLAVDKVGAGYTLLVSSAGLSGITSDPFTISHGAPSRLAFTVQPTSITAGGAITPAVQVIARDAYDNTATAFTGNITVAIGTNPGGATLTGTAQVAAVAGLAAFPGLRLDRAGTGYTLTAAAAGLASATSAAFTVTPGPATQLVFAVHPRGAVAAAVISPPVQVVARDAQGNTATAFTGTIALAIGTNPGGAVLTGPTAVSAIAGVATFPGLILDKVGSGYTLTATAASLTGVTVTSNPFDITPGIVTKLGFIVQPSDDAAGSLITPAVQVAGLDAQDNVVPSFTGTVTVGLGANPGGGTLSGALSAAAVSGVATFGTLSINRTGAGYTLTADAAGLTGATSGPFTISAAPATLLVFTVQPSNVAAGAPLTPAVRVTARDSLGNTATGFTGNVTVAIAANPSGGTLSGTATVAAVAGVATFPGLSVNRVGAGYTLSAAAAGANTAVSSAFNVVAGPATQLEFTAQPTTTLAGGPINPPIQVTARDAGGNVATGYTGSVTLAINTNPGGATLGGVTTQPAVAGVATFSGVSLNRSGVGYTLTAGAGGLTGATSAAFDITPGVATHLAFTVQPTGTPAGASITPAVQVSARDALGNTATSFTGSISLVLVSNPGASTLTGGGTVTAVAGVATFPAVSLNKVGEGYQLAAAAASLTGATSAFFTISPGPATQLVFTEQPTGGMAGATISPPIYVVARDAHGNTATSFTGAVTVVLSNNPGGSTLAGTTVRTAVGGVAIFSDLSLDREGSDYRLTANTPGLTSGTSTGFNINHAPGTHLTFVVQPSNQAAGAAIAPVVRVAVRDPYGNVVWSHSGTITLTLTAPNGATLSGGGPRPVTDGYATFPLLSVDKVGTGYTLQATSTGLTGTVSGAFDIAPAPASVFLFTVQPSPSTVAATPLTPAVEVLARDAFGNDATGFTGNVTMSLGANPGAGTLSGTLTVAATAGVASFANLAIDKAATGYTLRAAATGVTPATSTPFAITPGVPTQLAFTVQPGTATSATPFTPAVEVTARDAQGNTATSFAGTVTVAIAANPGGGTLSGTLQAVAVGGVATFPDLRIDRAAAGYTLNAAAAGLTSATSAAFTINPGPAGILVITTQPSNGTAGAAIAPAVVVTARDAQGNTATGFTGTVTMSIGTNPGGASLTGTPAVTAVAGVATFANLRLDRTGNGYTLVASATGVANAASAAFNISPASATALHFTVQPSSAVAAVPVAPAVEVTARDPFGNVATSFTGNVTLAIGNNPGGGVLSGTTTLPAAAGVVSFAGISIDRVGTGYTLAATAAGLVAATSAGFTITPGPAAQLVFTAQPSTAVAAATIAPAVQVTARDAQGNVATGFSGNVTVALANNPGASTLSGTTTVTATAGVATFSTLSLDRVGTGYTLSAAAAGLSGSTSSAFNITPGTAAALVFTVQPGGAVAGTAMSPAVVVTARDAQGNTATGFTGSVTMSIATNPGGGLLTGAPTVAAVAGVATFSNLRINRTGTGYTFTAAAAGLAGAVSAAFNITPAPATVLVFTVQPSSATAGVAIAPAVQITARDSLGNTATGFAGAVTLALAANPGGGTLAGTLAVAATAGVASFSPLSVDKVGSGYTLSANAAGITGATSTAFSITPAAAAQLAITIQPASTAAGAPIAPLQVTARDAFGNTATSFTGNVIVSLQSNPVGATLAGTKTVAAVAGIATFNDLSIDTVANGYTFVAAASGLTAASSNAFNIVHAAASQLVFIVQPTSATAGAGIAPAMQVRVRDAFGNTATTYPGSVTLAINANPGGATLGGVTTQPAVAGVATFSGVSLNRSGVGYTLTAGAGGLTGATSTAFDITPGVATQLAFTVQPTGTVAGASITPAVQVSARDAFGNTATSFSGSISLALASNPGASTLTGGGTVTAVAGVATFPAVSLNKVGEGYQLAAAASGLTGAFSAFFTISPGAPTQLVFTEQPTGGMAGVNMSPPIYVVARDVHGNTATSFTGAVTVVLSNNPGGSTLSGTTVRTAVGGVAIFSDLSLDREGTNYQLTASATGLTSGVSTGFNINHAPGTHLTFVVQPSNQAAGVAITPAVRVAVRDPYGNVVWSHSGTITLTLTAPNGAILSGGGPLAVTDGYATFPLLSVNQAGTYTLQAASGALTGATSGSFTITGP